MKILLTILLCLAMATPCIAKPKQKVSYDNNVFMCVEVDNETAWSDVGIPSNPTKNDEYIFIVDEVENEHGRKTAKLKLKKI